MRLTYTIIFFLLASYSNLLSQSGNSIFDNTYLHEIKINFVEQNYWEILNDNFGDPFSGQDVDDKPYLSGKIEIDGQIYDKVGIRFKGYSSFFFVQGDKKSFKLDFNEFVEDRKIDGLRKLNLNNGVGDPAFQREFVCYNLLRQMGIPAPRVAFAKVYINDEYWGLYSLVEQIDKSFLKDNYVDNNGALYKNIDWSTMTYIDENESSYPEFEKKTLESEPFSDLIELIKRMNSDKNSFAEDLEEVFYVDDYLKILAVDIITSNWDSYHYHGRNWYLYKDSTTQKFHWQPWDYNLALGGTFDGGDPLVPSDTICTFRSKIDFVLNGGNATLTVCDAELLNNASVKWFVDDVFKAAGVTSIVNMPNWINNIKAELTYEENGAVCYYDLSTDIITLDDWVGCPSTSLSSFPHDVNDSRVQEILFTTDCCEIWDEECDDLLNNLTCFPVFQTINLNIYQDESEKILNKNLMQIPVYQSKYKEYICNAFNLLTVENIMPSVNQNLSLIKDAIQTDPNYVYSYNNFRYDISEGNKTSPIPSILEFINKRREDVKEQMVALNINCESQSIDLIAWNEVVINELVSSNTIESGIVDEKGESEDWIELYNNTNKDLNLDGYFMTDKKSDLTKWAFPSNTIIKANDYLIVWADENKNDGPLHTNFKLSKSGEQLYISDGVMYVDSLTFSSLDDNESYSRIPNGTGGFVKKNTTFGFDNTKISSVTSYNLDKIQVFPNPATDILVIKHQNIITEISIYDIMGKILNTYSFINNNEAKVNISNLNPGIFFVEVSTNDYKTIKKFIKN